MKKIFNQNILIVSLIGLVFVASAVSADDAIAPPCIIAGPTCVASTNTPFPVTTGDGAQVKISKESTAIPPPQHTGGGTIINPFPTSQTQQTGGGLSVDTFVASAAAEFQKYVYFNGLVLGNPKDTSNPEDLSTLTVGGADQATFAVAGSTYVKNGGLYSNKVIAPAGTFVPVCSDTSGNIIFCPTPPPVPVPIVLKEHYAVAYNVSSETSLGDNNDDPDKAEDVARQGIPSDVVSLDTSHVLIDKLSGFKLTQLAHHRDGGGKGVVDSGADIWRVPDTATYDIAFSSYGLLSTFMTRRSRQHMDVSFYLKIVKLNGPTKLIPLAEKRAGGCTGAGMTLYPGTIPEAQRQRVDDTSFVYDPSAQYIMHSPDCVPGGSSPDTTDGIWTYRKHTGTISYDINYTSTMALDSGDEVYLYATGTGFGRNHDFSFGQVANGSYGSMKFTFSIDTLALDVKEH